MKLGIVGLPNVGKLKKWCAAEKLVRNWCGEHPPNPKNH